MGKPILGEQYVFVGDRSFTVTVLYFTDNRVMLKLPSREVKGMSMANFAANFELPNGEKTSIVRG